MITDAKEFWIVGKDEDDQFFVATAPRTDSTKQEIVSKFKGDIIDAVIEFDGTFHIKPGRSYFTLFTDEKPWAFVVKRDGRLLGKIVNAESASYLLSTSVVQVSAVRGFRDDSRNADQGLIVAYVKTDGTVWYTRLLKDVDGTQKWNLEQQLVEAGSGNERVQVIRLNDYRIGFTVVGCNKLFVTGRTYIGDTFKTEYVVADATVDFFNTPFRQLDVYTDGPAFAIIQCYKETNTQIRVHANYPFEIRDPDFVNLTVKTAATAGQTITNMTVNEDGDLIVDLKYPLVSPLERIVFNLPTLSRISYVVSPQRRPLIPGMDIEYKPAPYVYTEYIKADVTTTLVQFSMSELKRLSHEYTEYINADAAAELVQFSMSEIKRIEGNTTEYVHADATAELVQFTMTLIGSSPI